jgi:hypothetical protein
MRSHYAETAKSLIAGDQKLLRLTRLRKVDIEHCL